MPGSICFQAMEQLVDEGLVKSIGVSNYSSKQVQEVLDNSRIKPAINQVKRVDQHRCCAGAQVLCRCTGVIQVDRVSIRCRGYCLDTQCANQSHRGQTNQSTRE